MREAAPRPSQAPATGWARRILGPLHVTGIFWFRFQMLGARVVPGWAFGIFILLFTSFFFVALRSIRRAIASNLVYVLGPCGWWERQVRIFRTLWQFAWCSSERYEQLGTSRPVRVDLEGSEIWEKLSASGQGMIVVTAHLGNWETGSLIPASLHGRRVHVVREREMDPDAQAFIEGLLQDHGGSDYKTHFVDREVGLGVDLLWALRAGDIVALQGDRPAAGGRTTEARLFDRPLSLPTGPAALARAADVPLVPVFILREGRLHYRAVMRPPIRVPWDGDREASLREAVRRIAAAVEWAITEEPHQWFCFAELWPRVAGAEEGSSTVAA